MNNLMKTSKNDSNEEKKKYLGNESSDERKEGWKLSPAQTSGGYIVFLSQSGRLQVEASVKQEVHPASLSLSQPLLAAFQQLLLVFCPLSRRTLPVAAPPAGQTQEPTALMSLRLRHSPHRLKIQI